MREHLLLQPRSQPAVWFDRPTLESCPRCVADSWRHLTGRNDEAYPDTLRLVLLPRISCAQPTARDLWRSPRPAGHLGPAKKTAVCSGCGTRYRTFYGRTTRRVRDTDAAGWRLYLAFEQRRVACSRCQGVQARKPACGAADSFSTRRWWWRPSRYAVRPRGESASRWFRTPRAPR